MKTKLFYALLGIIVCMASTSHQAHSTNAAQFVRKAAPQAVQAVAGMAVLALAANPVDEVLPDLMQANRDLVHPPLYPQARHSDAHYRRLALISNQERKKRGSRNQNRQKSHTKSHNRIRDQRCNQPRRRS